MIYPATKSKLDILVELALGDECNTEDIPPVSDPRYTNLPHKNPLRVNLEDKLRGKS